jgi:hypothetical protein
MCLTLQNWTFRVLHTGKPASDRCSNFQLEDWFPSAHSTTKDAYRPWADIHRRAVCKKTSQVVSEATCYALLRSWDRWGKKAIAVDRWAAEENFRLIGVMDASATGGPIFCMGGWNLPLWQPLSINIEVSSDIQSSKVQVGLGFGREGGGGPVSGSCTDPVIVNYCWSFKHRFLFQYLSQGSGLHHWFFVNGSRDTACALGAKRAVSI